MGLEDNQQREQEERIAVSEDRLKNVLHEFKDELLDKIDEKFATKDDVRLYIAIGLLGGPMAASLITAAVTRMTPPEQVDALGDLLLSLF